MTRGVPVYGTGVSPLRIQSGNSGIPAGSTTAYESSPRGPLPPTLLLAFVQQFRGKCPLLSVTRPAIPGQAPVAVSYTSGNSGASALCCQVCVRQFRGKRPLPSVTRPAIPGQAAVAVSYTSGNSGASAHCRQLCVRQFRGKRPLPPVTVRQFRGECPLRPSPVQQFWGRAHCRPFRLRSCYLYLLISCQSDGPPALIRQRPVLIRYRSGSVPGSYFVIVCRRRIYWLFVLDVRFCC